VRYWHYPTLRGFLTDGLRLSRGMTFKNALAGLWWGGGKGVMAAAPRTEAPQSPEHRRQVYEDFGEFMTLLQGVYVTAEDVGTSEEDMAAVFSRTRFTTCIPARLGGSGNPSAPTALGVVRGMEAALAHLKMGSLEGKTVAMQGLGHVGEPMLEYLKERGVARVLGAELDAGLVQRLEQRFGRWLLARVVERGDQSILFEDVDIVSPNATGAILNAESIPQIRAKIVCGAANNQLADDTQDDLRLLQAKVLYMPDFLVNRMGIVNCADEQYGYVQPDPRFERHLDDEWENGIYRLSLQLLAHAEREGRSPHAMALRLARERSFELHPLTGHRGVGIVRALMARLSG